MIIVSMSISCGFGGELEFKDSYQKGLTYGKKVEKSASDAMYINPRSIYQQYNDSPPEKDYYGKNKTKDDGIKDAMKYEASRNTLAQKIVQDHANRPQFEIQKNSPSMKMNQWVLENAYSLTHDKSCKQVPSCVENFENISCFEQPLSISHRCAQRLMVDVKQTVDEKHYPIVIHFQSDRYYMAAIVNLTNGRIIDHGPRNSSVSIQGLLPANVDCNTLSGVVKSVNMSGKLKAIYFPSCTGLNVNFRAEHPSSKHRVYGTILIDIISRRVNTAINDYWRNDCLPYNNNNQCTLNEEHCSEGVQTRIIGGIPITRNCWAIDATYTCALSRIADNACKPLRDKGCEQIGSVCIDFQENQCISYSQTFRCPKKNCTYQTVCEAIAPCLDGDCSQHEKTPDPDFNQAVGSLGSLMNAAKSMDKNTQTIFEGKPMSCSKAPIGYLNCCGDGGWGEVLNAKCDQEEIELKNLREKHLAIQIQGEYCGQEVAGICVSYRKRYCVFQTKIARLIQAEGRFHQLNRNFGTGKVPNCSGITPADLQQIDFSKIDFSEIAEDIKRSFPDLNQAALVKRMNNDIEDAASKSHAN